MTTLVCFIHSAQQLNAIKNSFTEIKIMGMTTAVQVAHLQKWGIVDMNISVSVNACYVMGGNVPSSYRGGGGGCDREEALVTVQAYHLTGSAAQSGFLK